MLGPWSASRCCREWAKIQAQLDSGPGQEVQRKHVLRRAGQKAHKRRCRQASWVRRRGRRNGLRLPKGSCVCVCVCARACVLRQRWGRFAVGFKRVCNGCQRGSLCECEARAQHCPCVYAHPEGQLGALRNSLEGKRKGQVSSLWSPGERNQTAPVARNYLCLLKLAPEGAKLQGLPKGQPRDMHAMPSARGVWTKERKHRGKRSNVLLSCGVALRMTFC